MRAFVDSLIQIANNENVFGGRVTIIQPIPEGRADAINASDGLFTHIARGMYKGQPKEEIRIVGSIDKALKAYGEWDKVLDAAKTPPSKSSSRIQPKQELPYHLTIASIVIRLALFLPKSPDFFTNVLRPLAKIRLSWCLSHASL